MIVLWLMFLFFLVPTIAFNYWLLFVWDNKFPGTEAGLGYGMLAIAMIFFSCFLFLSALISVWLHWLPALCLGLLATPVLGYPTMMGVGALVDFFTRRKK
jgi:hypothetical protein